MMTISTRGGALLAAICLSAVSLSSCGQGEGKPKNSLENIIGGASNESLIEKNSAYTAAFNKLIDDNWSIASTFDKYMDNEPSKIDPSKTLYFNESINLLEQSLVLLKEGRALKGDASSTRADAAADKIIASGEALLAQWKELKPYYETRAYRTDNLAKAKAAHDSLVLNYQNTLAGIDELDVALTKVQRDRAQQRIADLRKGGHAEEADLLVMMNTADLFASAVIDENTAEADRLLAQLEGELAKVNQAEQAMPVGTDNKTEISSISGYISRMIGAWRDFKQNPSDTYFKMVIGSYNSAIERLSDVELQA